jgi:hypothetical protein
MCDLTLRMISYEAFDLLLGLFLNLKESSESSHGLTVALYEAISETS